MSMVPALAVYAHSQTSLTASVPHLLEALEMPLVSAVFAAWRMEPVSPVLIFLVEWLDSFGMLGRHVMTLKVFAMQKTLQG